jgi:hypothetical protein
MEKSIEDNIENGEIHICLEYRYRNVCQDSVDWIFGAGVLQTLFDKYNIYLVCYTGIQKTKCGKSQVEMLFKKAGK